MKKIIVGVLTLILLIGCSQNEGVDENELQTLKCDYTSETMIYDNILKIKNNEIISSVLSVYTETESAKKDVTESLEALFNTSFSYSEQEDLKILTSVVDGKDISEEMSKFLLLDTVYDQEKHSLEEILEAIEKHENKNDLSVVCKLI